MIHPGLALRDGVGVGIVRRMRHCRSLPLVVTLAVSLAACSAGDASSEPNPPPTPQAQDTATVDTSSDFPNAGDTSTSTTLLDPVHALLDPPVADAEAEARRRAEQDFVARCMREHGWQYWPNEPSPSDPEHLTPYGSDRGFGIVAGYETYVLPTLVGGQPPPLPVDRNIEYVNSLQPAERERYLADLAGDGLTGEAYEQSCQRQAMAASGPPSPLDAINGLEDRLRELVATVDVDPRVAAAIDNYRRCFEDAAGPREVDGRAFGGDVRMYLLFLRDTAMGRTVVNFDGDTPPAGAAATLTLNDGGKVAAVGEPSPIPDDELERLRATELLLWQADHDCEASSGIAAARLEVRTELAEQIAEEFPELATAGD